MSEKCRNCSGGAPKDHETHRIVRCWFAHCGKEPGLIICLLCGESIFKCTTCLAHIQKASDAKSLVCSVATCRMVLSSAQGKKRHVKLTHSNHRRYACARCHGIYKSRHGLRQHCRRRHAGLPVLYYRLANDYGQAKVSRKWVLRPGESLKCFLCSDAFTSIRAWLYHVNDVHRHATAKDVSTSHRRHYGVGSSYLDAVIQNSDNFRDFIKRLRGVLEETFSTTDGLEPRISARTHGAGVRLVLLHRRIIDKLLTAGSEQPEEDTGEPATGYLRGQIKEALRHYNKELNIVWAVNKTARRKRSQTIQPRTKPIASTAATAVTGTAIAGLEPVYRDLAIKVFEAQDAHNISQEDENHQLPIIDSLANGTIAPANSPQPSLPHGINPSTNLLSAFDSPVPVVCPEHVQPDQTGGVFEASCNDDIYQEGENQRLPFGASPANGTIAPANSPQPSVTLLASPIADTSNDTSPEPDYSEHASANAEAIVRLTERYSQSEDMSCSASAQPVERADKPRNESSISETVLVPLQETSELETPSVYQTEAATKDAGNATSGNSDHGIDSLAGSFEHFVLLDDGARSSNNDSAPTVPSTGDHGTVPTTDDAQAPSIMRQAASLESLLDSVGHSAEGNFQSWVNESVQAALAPRFTIRCRTVSLASFGSGETSRNIGILCHNCLKRGHIRRDCRWLPGCVSVSVRLGRLGKIRMTVNVSFEYSWIDWMTWDELTATKNYRPPLLKATEGQRTSLERPGLSISGQVKVIVTFRGRRVGKRRLVVVNSAERQAIIGWNWIVLGNLP